MHEDQLDTAALHGHDTRRPWAAARRLAGSLAAAATIAAAALPLLAEPAAAATVSDDTSFRDAWADPAVTEITLDADITLTCTGVPTRGAAEVEIQGQGHTITNPCDLQDTLDTEGELTLRDVTLDGADLGGNGVMSISDVNLAQSTITGHTGYAVRTTYNVNLSESEVVDNVGGVVGERRVDAIDSTISGHELGGATGFLGVSILRVTMTGNGSQAIYASSIGNVIVEDSTLAGNGLGIAGADQVDVFNSTIVDNESAGVQAVGEIEIYHTTLTGNATYNVSGNVTFHSEHSVLADAGLANCFSGVAPVSSEHTYADDSSCGLAGPGDAEDVDIESDLGPLADNGGPTFTRLPTADSVLVDAIAPGDCLAGINDQRGIARPQGAGCDVGAVERGPGDPSPAAPGDGTVAGATDTPGRAQPATPVAGRPTFTG